MSFKSGDWQLLHSEELEIYLIMAIEKAFLIKLAVGVTLLLKILSFLALHTSQATQANRALSPIPT